jgi:hypothetical protein
LPLAKAVLTFVVIVVSLNAVAVPVYAFFAAPSVSVPARSIEVLAETGALALVFCAKAGIARPIPNIIAGTTLIILLLVFITIDLPS